MAVQGGPDYSHQLLPIQPPLVFHELLQSPRDPSPGNRQGLVPLLLGGRQRQAEVSYGQLAGHLQAQGARQPRHYVL